ncbi:uncharacterized protein LOC131677900 [Topomyia yanbarensis]|uniref:uncharacterized protein LOC131677900 n=1 Tax=Topomyia yanbarensis TaxID=2498891 RepID=UPI00273C4851|nr:uncharacterized protein LOC131677900 [Topomyia yanbarensis]
MKKPSALSRCLVTISEISNLGNTDSKFLNRYKNVSEQWIVIGESITPIDCYIEYFLSQMFSNEKSKCVITCKSYTISFTMQLHRIEVSYYFDQSPKQLLALARQYKENGVKMFPKHPLFAHRYFSCAAKCLLSCAPLESLDSAVEGVETIREMQTLLDTLYLNISACLIKQNRYEEVLDVLAPIEQQENPSEKAVYRKALAHFHLKQFQHAITTLCQIDYSNNKDCIALYRRVESTRQEEDVKYNNMVKKMFG